MRRRDLLRGALGAAALGPGPGRGAARAREGPRPDPPGTRTLPADPPEVRVAALSGDGARLVTGGDSGLVRLWDAATGAEVRALKGHEHLTYAVAISPDGRSVAAAGPARLLPPPPGPSLGLGFGRYDGGVVRIWDAATGHQRHALTPTSGTTALRFSRDGQLLVAVGRAVDAWDVPTGRAVATLRGRAAIGWDYGVESSTRAGFSADARRVVFTSPGGTGAARGEDFEVNGGLEFWDLATGQRRAVGLMALRRAGVPSLAEAVALSPDGRRYATIDSSRRVATWDFATGALAVNMAPPRHPEAGPWHSAYLSYAPDGAWLAYGNDHGVVRIWEAATGRLAHELQGPDAPIRAVAFVAAGFRIVAGSGGHFAPDPLTPLKVWDVRLPGRP